MKEAVSCLQMKTGEAILRRETSHKEVEKREEKKERGMKKEQKKSTRCFYCIDLKLAAERRKRREGGSVVVWLLRWENRESAVEV